MEEVDLDDLQNSLRTQIIKFYLKICHGGDMEKVVS